MDSAYLNTMLEMTVEFDGTGRAVVAVARFREFIDTIRVNVRGAGAGGGVGRHGPDPG